MINHMGCLNKHQVELYIQYTYYIFSDFTIAPSLRQGYSALSSPSCLRLMVPIEMGSSG